MRIEENKELAPLTTLGIGGPARWFTHAQSEEDIAAAAAWARGHSVPLFVLGGGSNLLVSDAGFNGLVLQIGLKGIRSRESSDGSNDRIYEVGAGEDWDQFVQHTVDDNCAGLECLAGIPGTVGGTPVQNVGAYGQEVSSTIDSLRVFNLRETGFETFSKNLCEFGYRRSIFNSRSRNSYIVTRVDYHLQQNGTPTLKYADLQRAFPPGSIPTLKQVAEAVRRIRQSKGMLLVDGDPDCRSAGSFFKNPIVTKEKANSIRVNARQDSPRFPAGPDHPGCVKLSAAWLIENAGFGKGYLLGRVAISSKHTLALVNLGAGTAAEILALAEKVRTTVSHKFGIALDLEPVMLGFDDV